MKEFIIRLEGLMWSPVMLAVIMGAGVFLSLGTKFVQVRRFPGAVSGLARGGSKEGRENPRRAGGNPPRAGGISPVAALMTSLSATIGTGNIVGVAAAIAMGGPGAVLYMWIFSFFGGASKYAEGLLSILYREKHPGGYRGGPMYYIKNGLGKKWRPLAYLFAFCGFAASFGVGNLAQVYAAASAGKANFGIPLIITGLVIAALTALTLTGGIKSISRVSETLVPIMTLLFLTGCLAVIAVNIERLPLVLKWILDDAMSGRAVCGGSVGTVVRVGVSHGIFTNEAGLGSAGIAHASADTDDASGQGMLASLGTVIDTLILSTITALAILLACAAPAAGGELALLCSDGSTYPVSMKEQLAEQGVVMPEGGALTEAALRRQFGAAGGYIVAISVMLFGFSSIPGWYFYGSKCFEFMTGGRGAVFYKWAWVLMCVPGALISLEIVWSLSNILNAMMALPNILAMALLSPVVFRHARGYGGVKHVLRSPRPHAQGRTLQGKRPPGAYF